MQDILWSLKKYFIWIILTTIVAGAGTWFYTSNYVTPTYRSGMAFAIRASSRTGLGLTAGEQTADARLAALYCDLLKSDVVAESVEKELDSANFIPASAIKGMISASAVDDSPVLNIFVISTNPEEVNAVAEAFSKVAPEILPKLAGAGELYIIDNPSEAIFPVSPNIRETTIMGLLVGLIASIGVVIMIAVLDTTIWREEDLERSFDVPVLGSVPSMTLAATSAKSSKRRATK